MTELLTRNGCGHEKQERIDLSSQGVPEEITVCTLCGIKLDSRSLREQDMRDLNPRAQRARPETLSPVTPLIPVTVDSVVLKTLQEKEAIRSAIAGDGPANHQVGLCKKHEGGDWPECSTGARKAHECSNSKWQLGPSSGPCACGACHVGKDLIL